MKVTAYPVIGGMDLDYQELMAKALQAREMAYAPYSGFAVGAAVQARSGNVYTGCNIENASYGLTICAERTAVAKAVSAGERDLVALAVVADVNGYCVPCGACRQVLAEFGSEMIVVMGNLQGIGRVEPLSVLLPAGFVFRPGKPAEEGCL